MNKELIFGNESRKAVLIGAEKLARAVQATMGPRGRNVLVRRQYMPPFMTKDGVSVANEIQLPDQFENMGAVLVREAATKTNDAAGDGTTTATVLGYAMMSQAFDKLVDGANAIAISRGMKMACDAVVERLAEMATDVSSKEELKAVALISSQDEEIAKAVSGVVDDVGPEGVVTVEQGHGQNIDVEKVDGMQFGQGYLLAHFVTNPERMTAEYENPAIVIVDKRILTPKELQPLFDQILEKQKNIVLICEDIERAPLAVLAQNKMNGTFNPVVIKAPGYGDRKREYLGDIAALTGATVLSDESVGLADATLEHVGTAEKVIATKHNTTVVGGAGKGGDIAGRVGEIRAMIENSESDFDKGKLRERVGKLTGGVAVIRVGGLTETEQKERQYRVEDALNAARAARDEGVVIGAGTAYIRCLSALEGLTGDEDEKVGIDIVRNALISPCRQILENCGEGDKLKEVQAAAEDEGFNGITRKIENLKEAGVIDPKKVARCALENAVSVASMFVTLECAIGFEKEPEALSV